MTVDNPFPEGASSHGWVRATFLGAVSLVPVAGTFASELLAEGVRQAQDQRTAEWAAMHNARMARLEDRLGALPYGDPQFLASMTRLSRAAAESASDDKRSLLAAVAANSGAWSGVPYQQVDEFVSLVAELTPSQIAVLAYCDDIRTPEGDVPIGLGVGVRGGDDDAPGLQDVYIEHIGGRTKLRHFIEAGTGVPANDAWRIYTVLATRGLLWAFDSDRPGGRMGISLTSDFGHAFIAFLRESVS